MWSKTFLRAFTARTGAAQPDPAPAFTTAHLSVSVVSIFHTPVSSLGSDSPPPTPASPSPYLVHGHLADTEARRLEASPTIIIAVCQACATLPACQAWERACPLSLSLWRCVCAFGIVMGLHIIWVNVLENVLETWNSAPEKTENSYVRETWQIPRHCSLEYLARTRRCKNTHTPNYSDFFQHYSSNKNPGVDVFHFPLLPAKMLFVSRCSIIFKLLGSQFWASCPTCFQLLSGKFTFPSKTSDVSDHSIKNSSSSQFNLCFPVNH